MSANEPGRREDTDSDREEAPFARARERVRRRREQAREAAQEAARQTAERSKEASRAALRRVAQEAKGAEGIDADAFVDRRKKSRSQRIAERATEAARVESPAETSLRTVGDEQVVTEMARASGAEGAELLESTSVDESVAGRSADGVALPPGFVTGGLSVGGGDDAGDVEDGDGADEADRDPLEFDDPFGLAGGGGDA